MNLSYFEALQATKELFKFYEDSASILLFLLSLGLGLGFCTSSNK